MNRVVCLCFAFCTAVLFLGGCTMYMESPHAVIDKTPAGFQSDRIVTLTVTGKGVEPEGAFTKGQARILAERAAVADGYRQFVERIRGVYVDAYMKAGYGKVDEESVRTRTHALLRGVDVGKITHDPYGVAQASMSLRIKFAPAGMVWWPATEQRADSLVSN